MLKGNKEIKNNEKKKKRKMREKTRDEGGGGEEEWERGMKLDVVKGSKR